MSETEEVQGQLSLLHGACTCGLDDVDPYCPECNSPKSVGDLVHLGSWYQWGNGAYAGKDAVVNAVHDHRIETDDSHALIYTCQLESGGIDFPVKPSDLEEF